MPSNTDLGCTCSGAGCKFARFAKEALEDVFKRTFEQFERETVAAYGSYASPLASVGRGTLRGKMVGDALEVEIDVPAGAAGDAVLAANEDAGIVVRPFLDADRSEATPIPREDGQNAMAYAKASVRAFIVSSTDERQGWPEPVLVPTPEELAHASAPRLPGLRAMAVTITAAELAEAVGVDSTTATRLLAVAAELVTRYAPHAPDAISNEAVIRCAGWLSEQPAAAITGESEGDIRTSYAPTMQSALRHSGAMALLSSWKIRRAGAI